MLKPSFFSVLLYSLAMLGIASEQAMWYLDLPESSISVCVDLEKDTKDGNSKSKQEESDKYKPHSLLAVDMDGMQHTDGKRHRIRICSEEVASLSYPIIWTPPPERH